MTTTSPLAAPPTCFAPTPLCAAILLALPSFGGVAMDTAYVVLALRGGDPAHDLPIEDVAEHLVVLGDAGLVKAFAQPFETPEQMRWTRSERGDALPVVRARYHGDDGEEQGR